MGKGGNREGEDKDAGASSGAPRTSEVTLGAPLIDDVEKGGAKVKKYDSVFLSVCSFIVVTECCERLAFYGLTGSLAIFIGELGIDSALATQLTSLFSCLNYFTPVLGAYLADCCFGRFKTIWGFCIVYVIGMVMCTYAALPSAVLRGPIFFIGLFAGVAVGAGGIKPNVVVLGADQFDQNDPDQEEQKEAYFNYFYWAINIGATFSFAFLAYVAINGIGSIPAEYGFFASFTIPTFAMMCAVITFLAGSDRYIMKPPEGSALVDFVQHFWAGAKATYAGGFSAAMIGPSAIMMGSFLQLPGILLTVASFFIQNPSTQQALALLGGACIVTGMVLLISAGTSASWLDHPPAPLAPLGSSSTPDADTAEAVADVQAVVRLLPFVGLLIMFFAVYMQMNTLYVLQACQMDLRISSSFSLAPAQLQLFDAVTILVFIPLFDRFLYPAMDRCITLTPLRKMGLGFVFCLLAMLSAAILEFHRLEAPLLVIDATTSIRSSITMEEYHSLQGNYTTLLNSPCASGGDDFRPVSDVSIWWQVPQYMLIGTGEIFSIITAYDLFYSQVPASMRSVCQALNLLTMSLGSMVAAAVISILSSWVTNNLDEGHIDYVFFILAGMMLVNIVAFILVSSSYEYRQDQNDPRPRTSSRYSRDSMHLSFHSQEGGISRRRSTSFLQASFG